MKLTAVFVLIASVVIGADFQHTLSGAKPWTSEEFLDDPQEFHFAVLPDRTGGERKGVFAKAMDTLNLLRPAFVMSVGDLIECGGKPNAREQWAELQAYVSKLDMPFFYVAGNHDIWTGFTGMTPERQRSIDLWHELHGTNTYYSFTYKGCLFVCFNTMEKHDYFPPREPLPENQIAWALEEIEKHKDARWRFLFMHKPIDWTSDRWLEFERKINTYDYTVFCGDWHNYCTATRHGKKYYMIGTAGGGFDRGVIRDDLRYGIMDGITWVTMTKDKGPVVAHIALSGVHADTIQTCATTLGWIETPLDYPSHLAEDPAKYQDEKNTALIPTEVMHGDGYDWHFKHAIILRQGCVYGGGLEKFKAGKKRVVLLGDETASAKAAEFGEDWQVFDMGFKGDKLENVMWRVIQGTLRGYDPDVVVISAGGHNKGINSPQEIEAGRSKLLGLVRERAPKAECRMEGKVEVSKR
jgi:hypothetical protein